MSSGVVRPLTPLVTPLQLAISPGGAVASPVFIVTIAGWMVVRSLLFVWMRHCLVTELDRPQAGDCSNCDVRWSDCINDNKHNILPLLIQCISDDFSMNVYRIWLAVDCCSAVATKSDEWATVAVIVCQHAGVEEIFVFAYFSLCDRLWTLGFLSYLVTDNLFVNADYGPRWQKQLFLVGI